MILITALVLMQLIKIKYIIYSIKTLDNGKFEIKPFSNAKVSNEWAFGSGLSSYITKLSDYLNNNKMKNKLNLKIDGKVTRNFNEKFFISIGGSVSSKYLTAIENIKFNQKTESIFNSPYAQLNLTFGLILNDNKTKFHNEENFFNETKKG